MGEHKSSRLDGVFNALCDPTRRAILARLTDTDARVTDIRRISGRRRQRERGNRNGRRGE